MNLGGPPIQAQEQRLVNQPFERGLWHRTGRQFNGLPSLIPEVGRNNQAGVLQIHQRLFQLHLPILNRNIGLNRVDGSRVAQLNPLFHGLKARISQLKTVAQQLDLPLSQIPVPILFGRAQPKFVNLFHSLGIGQRRKQLSLPEGRPPGIDQQTLPNGNAHPNAQQTHIWSLVFGVHTCARKSVVSQLKIGPTEPDRDF